MDPASSLAFPGSRVLAGWWRQLLPHRPRQLWAGTLFLHRVEALTECLVARRVDPLAQLVLGAVALNGSESGSALDAIGKRLPLPHAALSRTLHALAGKGLLHEASAGAWKLTESGEQAARSREVAEVSRQRSVITFAERLGPTGARLHPPHPLPIAEVAGAPWSVDEAHRFDIALLRDCLARPPEWRERLGLPAGLRAIITDPSPTDWPEVVVDRPERGSVALIEVEPSGDWLGFAVQTSIWKLAERTPVLRLAAADHEALQLASPPLTAWQEAWRLWCRQRNLPVAEAEQCQLTLAGARLTVRAPDNLVQRLRQAKSDIFRGEAWLLAGDGYLRTGALLHLQE